MMWVGSFFSNLVYFVALREYSAFSVSRFIYFYPCVSFIHRDANLSSDVSILWSVLIYYLTLHDNNCCRIYVRDGLRRCCSTICCWYFHDIYQRIHYRNTGQDLMHMLIENVRYFTFTFPSTNPKTLNSSTTSRGSLSLS